MTKLTGQPNHHHIYLMRRIPCVAESADTEFCTRSELGDSSSSTVDEDPSEKWTNHRWPLTRHCHCH